MGRGWCSPMMSGVISGTWLALRGPQSWRSFCSPIDWPSSIGRTDSKWDAAGAVPWCLVWFLGHDSPYEGPSPGGLSSGTDGGSSDGRWYSWTPPLGSGRSKLVWKIKKDPWMILIRSIDLFAQSLLSIWMPHETQLCQASQVCINSHLFSFCSQYLDFTHFPDQRIWSTRVSTIIYTQSLDWSLLDLVALNKCMDVRHCMVRYQ